MGTAWVIQVAPDPRDSDEEVGGAIAAAFAEVARIESIMSEWRADSPLSAINAAAGKGMVAVPPELRAIIERGIAYGELTDGAFDITWRGMGGLWRFDAGFVPPSTESIRAALALVEFRLIAIDRNRVGLPRAGMAIGLGGMAKGYALDRAGAVLRKLGFDDFLIDGGGDLLCSGKRQGQPWRIGVQVPRGDRRELMALLKLTSGAVTTSGDYERFRIVDGVRYHHIIDPRTGQPARNSRSVTVVAPTAEEADVLATAIFVLGPVEGFRLAAAKDGIDLLAVDAEGHRWMTDGFRRLAELVDPAGDALGEVPRSHRNPHVRRE